MFYDFNIFSILTRGSGKIYYVCATVILQGYEIFGCKTTVITFDFGYVQSYENILWICKQLLGLFDSERCFPFTLLGVADLAATAA